MQLVNLEKNGSGPFLKPLGNGTGNQAFQVVGFPAQVAFSLMSMGNMSPKFEENEGEAKRNRQSLFGLIGLNSQQQIWLLPEHKTKLLGVSQEQSGTTQRCEGVLTQSPSLPLTILPADAFPVIVTDSGGSFLLLFNGSIWSADCGVVRSVIEQTQFAVVHSIEPKMMKVLVGPGICPYCYVSKVHGQFRRKGSWKPCVTKDDHIDLGRFLVNDLIQEGIPEEQIYSVDFCTGHSRSEAGESLFPSDLRSRRTGEKDGRFAIIASL